MTNYLYFQILQNVLKFIFTFIYVFLINLWEK